MATQPSPPIPFPSAPLVIHLAYSRSLPSHSLVPLPITSHSWCSTRLDILDVTETMLSSSLLGVALLAAGSMAQTKTTGDKASQSSADAAAATYTIAVGAVCDGLYYG